MLVPSVATWPRARRCLKPGAKPNLVQGFLGHDEMLILVFPLKTSTIAGFRYADFLMGLNITNDLVDVDHSHNQLLNTGRHGNPVVQQVVLGQQELTVYSTFQRHKAPRSMARDRQNRSRGDNCHLLYALKGKDGLRTSFGAIRRLLMHFDAILEDMVDQSGPYDLVIPMPSAHAISRQYGQRLADRYGCALQVGLFEKISKARARELLDQSKLSSPDKRSIAKRLGKEEGDFSLKDIPTSHREHFPPITLCETLLPAACQRFLLADDLLSTGQVSGLTFRHNPSNRASMQSSCPNVRPDPLPRV